jgi:Gas vesicle synthesis protein GvpO
MAREDDALARRAAREARRAARRARDLPEDQPSESGDDNGSAADPVRAAREAATAAAVGAAVGAVRALTARHRDAEDEPVAEDDEPLAAHEEEADEDEATMPEAEAEAEADPEGERRNDRGGRDRRERKAADLGQVERAVQTARAQLRQLSGTEAESVSSFARTRDGWRVTLEVVEVRRIPETTDVLASYAVELDDGGNLVAYERVRRYQRSEALDGS